MKMSTAEQYSNDSKKEETFRDEPSAAILDEKEWSYLQRYYDMSPRELQVARLVCSGFTNGDIANRLRVRPGTVKTHLRSIFGKTRTRNRISMLLRYVEKVHQFHHQNGIAYNTPVAADRQENIGPQQLPL
jgi:DNA-binding NarL/FixJ family response regulator